MSNPHLAMPLHRLGPERARLTVVLVHGRGQNDALTRDMVARLDLPDIAYRLPVAAGDEWYPGRYFDAFDELEPHLGWARAALERAVAGVPDERLVLAGFSQGACLVADWVARAGPRPLAGVGILTGCLLGAPRQRAVGAVAPGLPVLVTCARDDAWIPLGDARDTARRFGDAGAAVRMLELDDTEHEVSDAAIDALRKLLE